MTPRRGTTTRLGPSPCGAILRYQIPGGCHAVELDLLVGVAQRSEHRIRKSRRIRSHIRNDFKGLIRGLDGSFGWRKKKQWWKSLDTVRLIYFLHFRITRPYIHSLIDCRQVCDCAGAGGGWRGGGGGSGNSCAKIPHIFSLFHIFHDYRRSQL